MSLNFGVGWLLYCQHERGCVIPKVPAAELRNWREQLLVNLRGGIRRVCVGECGDSFHSEFFALRRLGFRNAVGKQKQPIAGAELHARFLTYPPGENGQHRTTLL
jgi:hypothetical protein